MKIFLDNDISKEVKFDNYFLENGFQKLFMSGVILMGLTLSLMKVVDNEKVQSKCCRHKVCDDRHRR